MPIISFNSTSPGSHLTPDNPTAPEINPATTVSSSAPNRKFGTGLASPSWLPGKQPKKKEDISNLYLKQIDSSELTREEWDSIIVSAIFSEAVYKGDWKEHFQKKSLPAESWEILKLHEIPEITTQLPGLRPAKSLDGRYFDKTTGLGTRVVTDSASKEINITIGPTTIGENTGDLIERSGSNKHMSGKHWVANIENASSIRKVKFHQCGLTLTQILVKKYPDHKVTVCGVSLGAITAQIAALGTPATIPVKAIAICTPTAGAPAKSLIKNNNPAADATHVLHLWIDGDIVPKVASWGDHYGRYMIIPPMKNLPDAPLLMPESFILHENPFLSIEAFYDTRGGNSSLIKPS